MIEKPPESELPEARSATARFWRIAGGYFKSSERRMAWGLSGLLIVLALAHLGVQVMLNVWNGALFDAIDRRDGQTFLTLVGAFAVLAVASLMVAAFQVSTKMRLQLEWRAWVTKNLLGEWLKQGRHYQLRFADGDHQNPDQRIAEDSRQATEAAVDFGTGLFNNALTLFAFAGVLWSLSTPLALPAIGGVEIVIPGYLLWAAIAYSAIGSTLTYLLGRPLVQANRDKLAREANFRFGLVRVSENSEGIALSRGDEDERRTLDASFGEVVGAWGTLRRHMRRLTMLTAGYTVLATAFPVLISAPQYFANAMTLGSLMQSAAAFLQVQIALSWFVDNYPRYADWKASVDRIHALRRSIADLVEEVESTDENSITVVDHDARAIVVRHLEIAMHDGTVAVHDANAEIEQGQRVLIVGESGTGKSTLFRAIAGLWPWGRGEIALPRGARIMFLPQRPYLPLGTLRDALCYPASKAEIPDDAVTAVLERAGLGQMAARLDETERWDQILSGGEQQRIAFARVLLQRPDWILMDEATAALDDDGQRDMMEMLKQELPGTGVISIGHRPGLDAFHDRTLTLVRGPDGARLIKGVRQRREQRRAQTATSTMEEWLLRMLVRRNLLRGRQTPASELRRDPGVEEREERRADRAPPP